jgi:hypothetical protein
MRNPTARWKKDHETARRKSGEAEAGGHPLDPDGDPQDDMNH